MTYEEEQNIIENSGVAQKIRFCVLNLHACKCIRFHCGYVATIISVLLTWVNKSVYTKNYLQVVVISDSDLKLISVSWNAWSIALTSITTGSEFSSY